MDSESTTFKIFVKDNMHSTFFIRSHKIFVIVSLLILFRVLSLKICFVNHLTILNGRTITIVTAPMESKNQLTNIYDKSFRFLITMRFWEKWLCVKIVRNTEFLMVCEFFLVCIFPYSDWKQLRILILFTQWQSLFCWRANFHFFLLLQCNFMKYFRRGRNVKDLWQLLSAKKLIIFLMEVNVIHI